MASRKGSVVDVVTKLAEPVAAELGQKIWDLEFVKEGAGFVLRFFIDKEGGVGIEDCEVFSRAIDKVLDEVDPIDQGYCLEVSSPGIERELRKDWHFESCTGKKIRCHLIRPLDGKRDFEGNLIGLDGDTVTIEIDGANMAIKKADAAYFRLSDEA
jgi:ribosome maturation factor RimP